MFLEVSLVVNGLCGVCTLLEQLVAGEAVIFEANKAVPGLMGSRGTADTMRHCH